VEDEKSTRIQYFEQKDKEMRILEQKAMEKFEKDTQVSIYLNKYLNSH